MFILPILQTVTSIAGLLLSGIAMRYLKRNINIINEKVYSAMMIAMATLLLIFFAHLSTSLYELTLLHTDQIPNLK